MKSRLLWLLPVFAFLAGRLIQPLTVSDSRASDEAVDFKSNSASSNSASASPTTTPARGGQKSLLAGPSRISPQDALRLPGKLHRLAAFADFLATATSTELAALQREWALHPEKYDLYWPLLFDRWVEIDLESALANRGSHLHVIMKAWATRDPVAALAWIDKHAADNNELRGNVIEYLLPKPGDFPPLEALRRIREIQGDRKYNPTYRNAINGIIAHWAKQDPKAAWQEAMQVGDPDSKTRGKALGSALSAIVNANPSLARELFDGLAEGKLKDDVADDFALALLRNGMAVARDFVLSLPDGPGRKASLNALSGNLKIEDLGPFLNSLPAGETQDPARFSGALEHWFAREPAAAGAFVKARLPADLQLTKEQDSQYRWMFVGWVGKEPRAAAEYLRELPPAIGAKTLDYAVQRMLGENFAETVQWVTGNPPSPGRDQMFASVAATWSEKSPKEAAAWLDTLPASSSKSAAVESFAGKIMSTNPDDALAWLQSLPDEKDRAERLGRVWRSWQDREAANRWRDTSPTLTAAEKAALLER
jgi:hypothetical protein